jgi:FKBP-type peptidyl-prolyl cis-trans isomerase FkpA
VVKLFSNKEEADAVAKTFEAGAKASAYKKAIEEVEKQLATNADQLKKDDVVIAEYLAKNNIKATKTKWGTYVAITTPGTGANLTEKDIAEVNYTGRNLKDSVFDSNTDPRFNHIETYPVKLNEFGVIPGWIDGLKGMQKGSVGKLIIPSSLAYGKEGRGGNIGPNEILVFDIAVVDVLSEQQYEAKQQAMQMKMQEMQQKAMEERMKQKEKIKGNAGADSTKKK